ncbi:MAG: cation:proton antiporter, partial [Armatimonadota bacterium]|nr:cation:proton antiporter [Armatimonadota bacterium]
FADIGVVLLMFTIGVEFSITELLRAGRVALYGAPAGIVLIVLLTLPVGGLLGWPTAQSLVVGAAVSVASTMVLLKFLLERRELHSPHGRAIVGITLMEDLAVVALTILVPVLATGAEDRLRLFGRGLLEAALVLAPLLWLARRLMPRLLSRVARTRNMELFLLVAISVAIGTAALTASLGLSVALGAFLAGLVVSESEFAYEALSRVLPMRDLFVALFFVSVGTLVRPASLLAEWPTVLALVFVVIVVKFAVWTTVVRAAGYAAGTAAMAGLGLTQIGEFSYVLAGVGRLHGLLSPAVYDAILATSLVTILANALLFRRTPAWLQRLLAGRVGPPEPEPAGVPADGRALLCGFGRVGRQVADALDAFGAPYTVIDLDPDGTTAAKIRGVPAVFGDAGSELILRRAGAERARLAVVAIPDDEAAYRCVSALRRMREDLPIIVRVTHEAARSDLLAAGATEVILPEVEAALTIVRHSLDRLEVDHSEGRRYLEEVRRHWSADLSAAQGAERPAGG